MMKKTLFVLLLPFILVLLLVITLFTYSSLFIKEETPEPVTQECLNQQVLNISESLKQVLNRTCIVKVEEITDTKSLNIVVKQITFAEIIYHIKNTKEWASSNVQESEEEVILSTTKSSISIKREKDDIRISIKSLAENVDEAIKPEPSVKPVQPVTPKPIDTSYKVSETEISKINTSQKIVVFTFDGGAGTQSLEKILEVLKSNNLKSTFFVTGKWAETQPDALRRISNAGHDIYNHTYSHPYLTKLTSAEVIEELTKANTKISSITGKETKPFYRPPYGDRNASVRSTAAKTGYQTVYWTIDALDWKESQGITASEVKARILNNIAPGNIYLMHIGDNITGQILNDVFTEIKKQGYQIKSLSEVLINKS